MAERIVTPTTRVHIVIVRSRVSGKFGYCPADSIALLHPELCEDAHYPSVKAADEAICNDMTIPTDAIVTVQS